MYCINVYYICSHMCTATHSDVPAVKFRETRSRLQFLSLTSSVEALAVLEVVRVECGRAAEKRLFHTGASKPLRLEEFDQTQQQATSQVAIVLRYDWEVFISFPNPLEL